MDTIRTVYIDSQHSTERNGSYVYDLQGGIAVPEGARVFVDNVSFTNTNHAEDQPVHLIVKDMELQKRSEYDVFAGPSERYCPAGVYEWVEEDGKEPRFQINAQNCIHCKTCDIKDPTQNINWVVPEGGGGPNYPNM